MQGSPLKIWTPDRLRITPSSRTTRVYKEEIFGPVLSAVRAKTYDEALSLCNYLEYGNGAAMYPRR